jgi:hypothetical protein
MMEKDALRKKAIDTVDNLLVDIESSTKRGAAVFGPSELLTELIPSFIGIGVAVGITSQIGETYTGDRRDLKKLLGCKDWVSTAHALSSIAKSGIDDKVRPGDYFRLPIKTNAGSFGGLEFKALDIPETELVVVQTTLDGKIIFNFEEVLFYSAINKKDTNRGGFKGSALCEYLNVQFLDALDPIRDVLSVNKDGNKVTLPTLCEVFGNRMNEDANWEDEPRQFEYFRQIKNRIRVKDNDTKWWWLSNAAGATLFAYVNNYGNAHNINASNADGGVAPAICVS